MRDVIADAGAGEKSSGVEPADRIGQSIPFDILPSESDSDEAMAPAGREKA